jgi:hypothetical protein
VFASSMIRRLVETGGSFCNDKKVTCYTCHGKGDINGAICPTCMGSGSIQDSQAFAHDLRHEMGLMWASGIKQSEEVQKFVAILKVIKSIIDTYINSLSRPVFLQGLKLPLQEMWELIKITIANGLSQFVDAILSPIDMILSGLTGIPEIRLALANECFGIDKLFNFLTCNLNNLKFSFINTLMKLIDFTIGDLVLINDIYLSRTRLASLESLSKLLGALINLILGLKDCYNASELVDEIVNEQIAEQYQTLRDIDDLLKESGISQEDLISFSKSMLGQEFPVNDNERAFLDGQKNTYASSFGEFGIVAESIVKSSLASATTPMDGEAIPTLEEFVTMVEKQSGISVSEVKESLLHIFEILRGTA